MKRDTLKSLRDRIEAAALERFTTRGYAATTTREIAAGVGLTAGALYAHYPSKEALFSAVVDHYRERLVRAESGTRNPVREALSDTCFPHDIPVLAAAIKDFVAEHGAFYKLWYVDVVEFGGSHFRSSLAPGALLEFPPLKERLAWLEEHEVLRVEPKVAFAMIYMQLFNYFLLESLFGGDRHYGVSEERAVEAIAEVFLSGMLAEGE